MTLIFGKNKKKSITGHLSWSKATNIDDKKKGGKNYKSKNRELRISYQILKFKKKKNSNNNKRRNVRQKNMKKLRIFVVFNYA